MVVSASSTPRETADQLTSSVESYLAAHPEVAELLHRFNDVSREYEQSLAVLNSTRLIVSDSSNGR